MNQGQIFMSTERIIVVDAVADAFAEKFSAKVATLAVGDPREGSAPLGAVVDTNTLAACTVAGHRCLGNGRAPLERRAYRRRADAGACHRSGDARDATVP